MVFLQRVGRGARRAFTRGLAAGPDGLADQ